MNTNITLITGNITRDIDLVIITLKLKITNLESDLQDSRDAWWRLKDQNNHYIKLYNQQKKNLL